MGWTYIKKVDDVIGYLKNELNSENSEVKFRILEMKKIGKVVYIATEYTKKQNMETRIFGTVVLTENSDGEFGYKIMDEEMGPCYYDCPAKILNLLTPPLNNNAKCWRELCWLQVQQKAQKAKGLKDLQKTLKPGNRVELITGCKPQTVVFYGWKGSKLIGRDNGLMYQISMKHINLEILNRNTK